MLARYDIITAADTAAALAQADAYLRAQPATRNVEEGQFGDSGTPEAAQALTGQHGSGSSGRTRTYNPSVNSRVLYH